MKQTTLTRCIAHYITRQSCTHTPRARAATGLSQNSCEGRVPPLRKQRYDPCAKEVVYRAGSEAALFVLLLPFLAADGDAGAMLSATKAAAALARRKSEAELSVSAS